MVSKIYGNEMGYIDFDGKRYWDVRDQTNHWITGSDMGKLSTLGSDYRNRIDIIAKKAGDLDAA